MSHALRAVKANSIVIEMTLKTRNIWCRDGRVSYLDHTGCGGARGAVTSSTQWLAQHHPPLCCWFRAPRSRRRSRPKPPSEMEQASPSPLIF